MPELPDLTLYLERLEAFVLERRLERIRILGPSLLRSAEPPISEAEGRHVRALRRLGKRIVLGLDDDLFLVLHLMIAGRLRWRAPGSRGVGRAALARFDFGHGTLWLSEASKRKRASLYLERGEAALRTHDPGGLEVLEADLPAFRAALTCENHTLKRALTDPRILAGIGNAYSDEILHRARLSPVKRTAQLRDEELARLHRATLETLREWIARLREEVGDGFPERVTAFREGMAVHGRHREPCPDCGARVQRIVHAENETNYCPGCQTGGRLLADRALSRLLRGDWPRTWEELEQRRGARSSD